MKSHPNGWEAIDAEEPAYIAGPIPELLPSHMLAEDVKRRRERQQSYAIAKRLKHATWRGRNLVDFRDLSRDQIDHLLKAGYGVVECQDINGPYHTVIIAE